MSKAFLTYALLFYLAVVLVANATNDSSPPCPPRFWYPDVVGMSLRCYQAPQQEANHKPCFKDFLWRWLMYSFLDPLTMYDGNPSNVLDLDVCKWKCRCVLDIVMDKVLCTSRSPPPNWATTHSPTHKRPSTSCRDLAIPAVLRQPHIAMSAILDNFPIDSSKAQALLDDVLYAVENLNVDSLTLNVADNPYTGMRQVWPSPSPLDTVFMKHPFKNLKYLQYYVQRNNDIGVQWPSAAQAIGNITSTLVFFTIYTLHMSPAIPRPPFIHNVRVFICIECFEVYQVPKWISEAENLFFFAFTRYNSNISFQDFPPSNILTYLTLSQPATPLKTWPKNFSIGALYPNLEALELGQMGLDVVPSDVVQNLPKLRYLDISGNNLFPLPSLKGLFNLIWLEINGNYNNFVDGQAYFAYTAPTVTGACHRTSYTTLHIQRSDFQDLYMLQTLRIRFYLNLTIDDDAFYNMSNLQNLGIDCCNLAQFPMSLRYATNIHKLFATNNPLNSTRLYDPNTWAIPVFIPKYYKQLSYFLFGYNTAMPFLPPSLFLFTNVSKSTQLFATLYGSVYTSTVSKDSCEAHKFETVYKLMPANLYANISPTCDTDLNQTRKLAMSVFNNMSDIGQQTQSGNGEEKWTTMIVLVGVGFCLYAQHFM